MARVLYTTRVIVPTRSKLYVLVLAAVLSTLAAAIPAQAQQGAASRLGDPTTGAPARARPAPRSQAGPEPDVPPPPEASALPQRPRGYGAPRWQAEEEAEPNDGGPPRLELDQRLRVLDVTWATLGSQGGPDFANAILSVLGGGIEIALGALFLEFSPDAGEVMAPFLITLGATTIVRTILTEFALRPDPRGPALEYQHMANGTRAQRLRRLEYGERQLAALAERSLVMRLVDGGLNIGAAVAVATIYLAARGDAIQPLEAFIFIGPAISLVTGIITLASPTSVEQRWSAYQQMVRRMEEARERGEEAELTLPPAPGLELDYGIAFDPNGGGFATVTGRF